MSYDVEELADFLRHFDDSRLPVFMKTKHLKTYDESIFDRKSFDNIFVEKDEYLDGLADYLGTPVGISSRITSKKDEYYVYAIFIGNLKGDFSDFAELVKAFSFELTSRKEYRDVVSLRGKDYFCLIESNYHSSKALIYPYSDKILNEKKN